MNSEKENKFEVFRSFLKEEALLLVSFIAVYRRLQERRTDRLNEMNLAPAFFSLVFDALNSAIIHKVHNLFDEKGERGIFNFLKFIENNRDIFTIDRLKCRVKKPIAEWISEKKPVTFEMIEEDKKNIRNLACLQSFKTRRDKYYAHFDKKYIFNLERLGEDAPIIWGDFKNIRELLGELIDRYSSAYDGQLFVLEPINSHDIDGLLDRLHESS